MRLSRLFPRWSGNLNHRPPAQPRRARLGVHAFEPRITPDVTLSHGHLMVNGNTDSFNVMLLAVNGIGGVLVEFNGRDFSFDPGAVTDITVNTNALSTVYIGASLAHVPATINCTDSLDDIVDFTTDLTVGGGGNLDNDAGPVTLNGNGRTDVELADDQHASDTTYTVTFQSVHRPGFGGLTYSNISNLRLQGGSGNNTFNVQSTLAGTQDEIHRWFGK